ncbi:MAG TPA: aminopeptidase [Roseiflexaceae bacterium]|nr:aminopeptidase [Roseiflexaceae bacterium]
MALDFEQHLRKYAELAVKIGANVQPGQRLIIQAGIDQAMLVRLIVASAYQAGARLVEVIWDDEQTQLIRFQHAPRDSFEETSNWLPNALLEYAQQGDALISIRANDPDLLKDQDPKLVALAQKASSIKRQPFVDLLMRNEFNWLVVSAPIDSWAAKVFPGIPAEQRVARLWDTIFEVCRLKQADPIGAWEQHIAQLTARSDYLNRKQYAALKYSAPGTDLTIGLPKRHVWKSARDISAKGIAFVPNMPTEEVFTMPHKDRVSGMVTSSKPLNYAGTLIENFRLTFAEGRVIDIAAESGEAVLRKLIETDEGAGRLGEVALVPHNSPIAQSGLLFYNTLFDENAASHIALGRAYQFTLAGGTAMTDEQFAQAGGNNSLVHVDFMIGTDRMDIDALADDGTVEPLMRGGEWAFDV